MKYEKRRLPAITCPIAADQTAEIEVDFPFYIDEGWRLYTQLANCRKLNMLVAEVLPLLKAASLLTPNPTVEEIEKLLTDTPKMMIQYKETFMRQQKAIQERVHHDPRLGVRTFPR